VNWPSGIGIVSLRLRISATPNLIMRAINLTWVPDFILPEKYAGSICGKIICCMILAVLKLIYRGVILGTQQNLKHKLTPT